MIYARLTIRSRVGRSRQRDIRGTWIYSEEFRLLIVAFSLMLYPYQSLSPVLRRIERERIILMSYDPMFSEPRRKDGLKDLRGKEGKELKNWKGRKDRKGIREHEKIRS